MIIWTHVLQSCSGLYLESHIYWWSLAWASDLSLVPGAARAQCTPVNGLNVCWAVINNHSVTNYQRILNWITKGVTIKSISMSPRLTELPLSHSEVKCHHGDQSPNFVGKINYRKVWAKLNFGDESTASSSENLFNKPEVLSEAFIPLNLNDKSDENISSFFLMIH